MLDAVPDQVMICSNQHNDSETQPLYNNLQMRQFFGTDVVEQSKKIKQARNKAALGQEAKKVMRRNPFYNRVFMDRANS